MVRGSLNIEGIKQIIIYMLKSIYTLKNGNLVSLSKGGFTDLEQENAYKYSEMLDWNLLHQYKLSLKYI